MQQRYMSIGSKMKRDPSRVAEGKPWQKRAVAYRTCKKWCTNLDCKDQTELWLSGGTASDGGKIVVKPVCSKFKASIRANTVTANNGVFVQIQFMSTSKTTLCQISTHTQYSCWRIAKKSCTFGIALLISVVQALPTSSAERAGKLRRIVRWS